MAKILCHTYQAGCLFWLSHMGVHTVQGEETPVVTIVLRGKGKLGSTIFMASSREELDPQALEPSSRVISLDDGEDGAKVQRKRTLLGTLAAALAAGPSGAAAAVLPGGLSPLPGDRCKGEAVVLRSGLTELKGLRAGQRATVTAVWARGELQLRREADGEELDSFRPQDLAAAAGGRRQGRHRLSQCHLHSL